MAVADSDESLVARSRDGDTEAFRELFDRKHRRVYLIAYQVLGDVSLAEDIVQDVFVKLWQHCADYREELPLDAWLRRISTNRAIDLWRSRRTERRRRVEPAAGTDAEAALEMASTSGAFAGSSSSGVTDPESIAEWHRLQAIWDELAEMLPPQQRAAFVLRQIEGLPTAEVAETLDCSASTVRSHVAEARSTLRKAMANRYPELLPPV
jgi:RNA polymerase sigma-70 factor (ECF subfamily)